MNASESRLYDAHLHFGDPVRLRELMAYLRSAGLSGAALLSLPYPGWVNFNPEVLLAKARRPRLFWAFGSLELDYDSDTGGGKSSRARRGLAEQVRLLSVVGFDGLKLWTGKPSFQKRTGLAPDSPQLSATLSAAGEEGLPVLIHAADPREFWVHRSEAASEWAPFDTYIEQAERAASNHPATRFVFPHLLFLADDLPRLASILQAHPNVYLDTAPGNYCFAPLHRTRRQAERFFSDYRSRILFGTDGLFFPKSFEGIPYMDTETVRRRFRTTRSFFLEGGTIANPFPYNRQQVPSVTGMRLDQETTEALKAGAFRQLFPEGVPKKLNREAIRRYIQEFPRKLEFDESLSVE